jgi:hypothetical protein
MRLTLILTPFWHKAIFNAFGVPQLNVSDDDRYLVLASLANLTKAALAPCTHSPVQELAFCRHVYLSDRETSGSVRNCGG